MPRVYRGHPVEGYRLPTDRTGWLAYVTSLPLILSATALGLHWPGAVFADEDDAPTPLTLGTEQITATRGSRLAHDVAAAVTVVDQSEIEVAMPQVLSEALRGRVGKFFQQTTHGASTSASPSTCGSNWVNGQQSTVNSQQSTVNSQQSMVNGQRDTVNGEQRTANSEQRTVNSEQ